MSHALSAECTTDHRIHLRIHGQSCLHETGSMVHAVGVQQNPNSSLSNSFLQLLPLPSRSNPHRLLHDRPLQSRRPNVAARHRNNQGTPSPPLLRHEPIRSTMFRSHQPATRRPIRPNVRVHTRNPTCKSSATTSAATRPAGLHAVPGTTLQRHWLWGQLLLDGATDA